MRIEDNQLGSVSSAPTQIDALSPGPQGAAKAGKGSIAGGDQVQVSAIAQRISTELATQDASRADRVNQVAASFEGGTYSIDSAQVSGAMVADALNRPAL